MSEKQKVINWKIKIKGFNNDEPFISNFRPINGDVIKLPNEKRRRKVVCAFFDFENEIINIG
jgi:hypothetical protein